MKKSLKQLLACLCSVVLMLGWTGLVPDASDSDWSIGTSGTEDGQPQDDNDRYPSGIIPTALSGDAAIFYSVTINKTDDSTGNFTPQETVKVSMAFEADSLQSGDTVVITLPNELALISNTSFPLYNSTGISIAGATTDTASKSITITFNDAVNGLRNISGELTYTARIGSVEAGDYSLQFQESGSDTLITSITVEKGEVVDYDKPMHKWGTPQSDGSIKWTVYVNFNRQRLSNAVIEDEPGAGCAWVGCRLPLRRPCDQ